MKKWEWADIVDEVNREAKLPLSVHIPLNWPESHKLIMCDCAMNAYTLDTPGLNTSITGDSLIRQLQRTTLFSWAFGDPAFVPDFRQTVLRRAFGGLPIIEIEFSAWNLIYTCLYFVDIGGNLRMKMTVRNDDPKTQTAHVWLHPGRPLESKVFEYHYYTFEWDASRWLPDDFFDYHNGMFYTQDGVAGRVSASGFNVTWVKEADFTGKDVNALFSWEKPYRVQERCKLGKMNHLLHFTCELKQGESQSFDVSFVAEPRMEGYDKPFDDALKEAVKAWKKLESKSVVELPYKRDTEAFEAVMLSNLQLLMADGDRLRPCQGGSSERFYVWVWEAMCSLRPMLKLGYFKQVRKAIDFIFSLQDGGCPPVGKFTTTKGAIGTSGPKWANTTGAALILACDYLELSGDKSFIKSYLDKMLRAGRWIIGEIRATRTEGNPNYGIMPECCASDGDYGQVVFTDCWTLGGLQRLRDVLKIMKHPDYEEFLDECCQYKLDFDNVLDRVSTSDGFISRSFGDDSRVCNEFRFTDTCLDCVAAGVSSALEPRMANYLKWLEENAFRWLFCSEVTPGIYYVGNNELTCMKMYLEQEEWKKAWMAARVFRRFVLTPDVHLTAERYSANDIGFTAWQPNGSNNGRFIEMELSRFWYELPDGCIIVGGGLNPFEREKCPKLIGIHTRFGKTDVVVEANRILVKTEKPMPKGQVFIYPEQHHTLKASTQEVSLSF
ncbi:MAG: hypothetical protein IKX30_11640 [Victivallales bacterium]|nr:hypothetical protein [Victivallales bacterium]